jgi:Kelch motif
MGLTAAVCDAPASGSGQWVYAIGGTNNNLLAAVAGYDTVQKKCSARPSMPTARSAVAAATSPGRIHVLGGFANADLLTTHEVYEPANDAWSTAAPLPTGRGAFAAVTGPDGLIYSIGGTNGTNSLATVAAFTTDKCYPIEQRIGVVENNLSIAVNSLGDLPPQARAGAEKELAALRSQLVSLEGQLKTCRGQ